jgi:C4-dicarboxylate transporter, DctM subunit
VNVWRLRDPGENMMVGIGYFVIVMTIMVLLLLGGLWIAFAIGVGGVLSLYPVIKAATFNIYGIMSWDNSVDYILLALPLFIFMGEFISSTGLVDKLYLGASRTVYGMPGGLVQTNIFACTIFAACSGSSLASAATMSRVAYPEQVHRRGYNPEIVLGSIAAGGTLGILIPPSIFFIVYGTIADQSVGRLFLGGVVPGILMSSMFMLYVAIRAYLQPNMIPKGDTSEVVDWKSRLSGLKEIWPFLLLITGVMGSLYGGLATPTEAAGVGGFVAILIAAGWRLLTWKALMTALLNTVRTNCMIFLILINAKVVAVALGYYGIPNAMKQFAQTFPEPIFLLLLVSVIYLVLGTIFEDFSLMLLILPFVIPLIQGAGYDLIWFGVYMCIMLQAGLLSPPVGMNLFVIQGVTGAPLSTVIRGSVPFFILMLLTAAILVWQPSLALWLPKLLE